MDLTCIHPSQLCKHHGKHNEVINRTKTQSESSSKILHVEVSRSTAHVNPLCLEPWDSSFIHPLFHRYQQVPRHWDTMELLANEELWALNPQGHPSVNNEPAPSDLDFTGGFW